MPDWIIQFLCSLGALIVVAVAYHWGPQSISQRKWIPHVVAVIVLVLICVLLPTAYAKYMFTPLTMVTMGTFFPIYEVSYFVHVIMCRRARESFSLTDITILSLLKSVRAVCTPLEDDDKAWLQYWMVGGVLFMGTEWVGRAMSETSAVYWYEVSSFFFVWLYYPLTNGANLIYEYFTKPYISPRVKPLATKMNNAIMALYQAMTNAVHLWYVFFLVKGRFTHRNVRRFSISNIVLPAGSFGSSSCFYLLVSRELWQ